MTRGTVPPTITDRWATVILPRVARLQQTWRFTPTTPSLRTRILRRVAASRAVAFPAYHVLRPVTAGARWNCLFLFCPTGVLDAVQARILHEVRALRGQLLVVVALPPDTVPPHETEIADALVAKDLAGFDFSAYRIALALIAENAPGALVYVQNDSVFGPVTAIDPLIETAPWDLTGFIATPVVENHISSFAFVLRAVTPDRLVALAAALPADRCYDRFTDVVAMQETRLARVAARHMTVGSYWTVDDAPPEPSLAGSAWRRVTRWSGSVPLDLRGDPMLGMPLELVRRGFPFVKRSLFSKFAGSPDAPALAAILRSDGWPVADPTPPTPPTPPAPPALPTPPNG